ncbi:MULTISPECIES: hypothetical protein [unclassified Wolbachia]|uniref:hypothetical protein n=1 Tax=unclassified Wolbachia TaxID=2640676 RepID=UPI0022305CB6|nr:hypothetical protein [Wolbachia endosymbiont (group A) of Apoderus coryli]
MSFQCLTLKSSPYYAAYLTRSLKLSFLDPSSQGTGMTGEGTSLTTVIPLRVSGI